MSVGGVTTGVLRGLERRCNSPPLAKQRSRTNINVQFAAGFATRVGAIGTGIGVCLPYGMGVQAMGHNPEAGNLIRTNMMLGMIFTESVAVFSSGSSVMRRTEGRHITMAHRVGLWISGVVEMHEEIELQEGVSAVGSDDFTRVVEVWEASVRATHEFVTEAVIEVIRPLVRDGLPYVPHLLGVRESTGQVAGFIGVEDGKVEMLYVHPAWRGQGIGRRLLSYAVTTLGTYELDVNEQNPQAIGFYLRMGFEVVGRSAVDSIGKPYPLLHMRIRRILSRAEPHNACQHTTHRSAR